MDHFCLRKRRSLSIVVFVHYVYWPLSAHMHTDLYVPLSDAQTHTVGQLTLCCHGANKTIKAASPSQSWAVLLKAVCNHLRLGSDTICFDFQEHYIVLCAQSQSLWPKDKRNSHIICVKKSLRRRWSRIRSACPLKALLKIYLHAAFTNHK